MEWTLVRRRYHTQGINGDLYIADKLACFTIELPWQENRRNLSCIPPGRYLLTKRYSAQFGQHFLVNEVANRTLILIHPANNALLELRGCIAPVQLLTGPGRGSGSKKALAILLQEAEKAFRQQESIFLTVEACYSFPPIHTR